MATAPEGALRCEGGVLVLPKKGARAKALKRNSSSPYPAMMGWRMRESDEYNDESGVGAGVNPGDPIVIIAV